MAHFTVEYTHNIEPDADLPRLFADAHRLLADTGVFPVAGLRSRALRLDTWRVADGAGDYAFVHATFRMGHGRDAGTRRLVAEAMFALIKAHFAPLQSRRLLALSFELTELDAELSFKHNNIHERFAS